MAGNTRKQEEVLGDIVNARNTQKAQQKRVRLVKGITCQLGILKDATQNLSAAIESRCRNTQKDDLDELLTDVKATTEARKRYFRLCQK